MIILTIKVTILMQILQHYPYITDPSPADDNTPTDDNTDHMILIIKVKY